MVLIDFCLNELNLNRIEIKCGVENTKSKNIFIRLHFTHEGIIRQGELIHDKFIDLNIYSFLKTDEQNKSRKIDYQTFNSN